MGKYLFTFVTFVFIPCLSCMVFYPVDYTYDSNEIYNDDTSKIIEMEDGWNNCTVRKNIPCSIEYDSFACMESWHESRNLWASKPRNLLINFQYEYMHQMCHTYVTVSWSLPGDASAISSLTGFQLEISPMDGDDVGISHCLTFDLRKAKITEQDVLDVLFNFSHFKPMTGRMHFLLTSLPSTGVDGFSNSVNLDVVIPRATPVRSGDGVYCRLIHTTTPSSFSVELTTVLPTKSVSQELYWSAVGLLAAVTTLLIIILIYVGCKRMRKHPRHVALVDQSDAASGIRNHPFLAQAGLLNDEYDLHSDVSPPVEFHNAV